MATIVSNSSNNQSDLCIRGQTKLSSARSGNAMDDTRHAHDLWESKDLGHGRKVCVCLVTHGQAWSRGEASSAFFRTKCEGDYCRQREKGEKAVQV